MKKLCVALISLLLSIASASAATVAVYWNPSTDTGGSGLAGYKIYRDGSLIGTSTTTGYLDSTAAASTTYSYTVSAYDNAGNESAQGTAFSTRTGTTVNVTCSGNINTALANAISSAADGDTIVVSNGSCSISTFVEFDNAKGVSLVCASVGGCNIAVSTTALGMNGSLSGTNNKFYRISGFNWTASTDNFVIWFYGTGTLSQFRIDHNSFVSPADADIIVLGENSTVAKFYGSIDNNTFSSSGSVTAVHTFSALNPTPPSSPAGLLNNLFVENNTITITTMTNAGRGCVDGWGAAFVYRYNISTNCLVTTHGVVHAGGPPNFELYNNQMIVNSGSSGAGFDNCFRCFHHQGSGEFYAFNNTFTASGGKSSVAIGLLHYRAYADVDIGLNGLPICDGTNVAAFGDGGHDGNRATTATNRGYPCWHQPGRDFAASPAGGNLKPMYAWNNYWSDTLAIVQLEFESLGFTPNYTPQHAQNDREYYNSVSASAQTTATSPFNGTTGMGFGTLARRPTTCTTGAETGGGVGYFATDQGAQGILYRCSATNTWTVHYTPYVYPHPLVH